MLNMGISLNWSVSNSSKPAIRYRMSRAGLKKVVSAPGGLKEEISDFKQRRIREEASHLFYQHGYEGATIDAIAKRLDVTKPFIYAHYKNKISNWRCLPVFC